MPFTFSAHEDGASKPEEQATAQQQALLRERDGYIARGLTDRVAAVEAALVAAGIELVERADEPPVETERAVTQKRRK